MQFRILGPLEVADDAGRPVELSSPKLRALVCLLLLEPGRVVALDTIIDRLWSGEPPATSTATLQAYVSQLRRLLEPDRAPRQPARVLATRPPGYLLHADALDSDEREQLLRRGEQALLTGRPQDALDALERARRLVRGRPLDDVADEPYAAAAVARLEHLGQLAEERHVDALLAVGAAARAVVALEELVRQAPLHERFRGQLVEALYRAGRPADALAAAGAWRRHLADELGLDPSPALQELERAVLTHGLPVGPAAAAPDGAATLPGAPVPAAGQVAPPVSPVSPVSRPVAQAAAGRLAGARALGGAVPRQRPPADPGEGLVGRAADRAVLDDALQAAAAGRGGVVTLEGEAGIGKTRLAEAALAQAARNGARVVAVRCLQDVGAPPLWPWLQARAGLSAEPVREVPVRDALATGDDREAAAFGVLDGLAGDLVAAAGQGWALVVVDDLQWADRASLQLLRLLAPRLSAEPLLVLASVRRPDAGPGTPVEALLADLVRERGTRRLALGPLPPEAACELVQRLTGGDATGETPGRGDRGAQGVDAATARALAERSGGNPFFLRELVSLLRSEHRLTAGPEPLLDVVPDSVRGVIARRLERLPEESRALLRAAAVAGPQVELEVLAAATATDPERVCDLLDPAVVTGLLVELDDRLGWRFSHALVRDAVRLALPRPHRARLHAAVARALASTYAQDLDVHLDELSHHSAEALGVLPAAEAVRWATAAADRARARYGWDLAARHRRRAVRALGPHGQPAERFEMLLVLAEELRLSGDVVGADWAIGEALEIARELDDDLRAARALAMQGAVVLWNSRAYGVVDDACVGELERLLQPATRAPLEDPVRVELLATLGVELYYGPRRPDGERAAEEAVRLARRLGDPALRGRALNAFVLATWYPERDDARAAALDEALALVGAGLPVHTEVVARLHRAAVRVRRADLDGAQDDLARCAGPVATLGVPELRSQLLWARCGLALLHDERARVEELREEAFETMPAYGVWGASWCRHLQLVELRSLQGRVGEVADDVVRAAEEAPPLRPVAALAVARAGDLPGAAALLQRWGWRTRPDWNHDHALACWGEVAALTRSPEAAALYDVLLPLADRLVVAGTVVVVAGSVSAVLGRLAQARGDLAGARRHLQDALRVELGLGAPAYSARTSALLRALDGSAVPGAPRRA